MKRVKKLCLSNDEMKIVLEALDMLSCDYEGRHPENETIESIEEKLLEVVRLDDSDLKDD